ncbi:RpnC/YadD family protein [Alteribacillus iranensis]|uniref:PD-(D/E)XK nuclease family transposase n=1 Tax=Alteribacillus iranensis TaxID=930128 RepID=A0A1I2BV07_9BACI|nr:hypothetical protein [Alteribacillus iranensis]SFE59932.1 conserved hypothetical protein (putative transposase or invertase) [Alteribacillus iranensis]
MKDETLRPAFQNWEVLSGTEQEVIAYEARLKRVLDEEAAVREAEIREQEARQKARQEARQEEREDIARRLLAKEMDVGTVADITKLHEERVIEIQKEMN